MEGAFQLKPGKHECSLNHRIARRAEGRAAHHFIADDPWRQHQRERGQRRQHVPQAFWPAEQKQEHRDRNDRPAEGIARQCADTGQNPRRHRQAEQPAGARRCFARTLLNFEQQQRQPQKNHQQQHRGQARRAETPEQFAAQNQDRREPRDFGIKKFFGEKKCQHDDDEQQHLIENGDEKIRLVTPETSVVRPKGAFKIHPVIKRQHLHQPRQHERIHRRIRQIRMRRLDLRKVGTGVGQRNRVFWPRCDFARGKG